MTDPSFLAQVLALAAARFPIPRAELAPDDDIFERLGIDSLQALELLSRLEERFGVEIPDFELRSVRNFHDLARLIEVRR